MNTYYKFPKIFHFDFSPNLQNDDRVLPDISAFHGKEIISSLKCDGECTTFYNDRIHARSVESKDHESRHRVKQLWASVKYNIDPGWRICGENLAAKHSIFYNNLPSYFLVFTIFNGENVCLNYNETKEFCELLGLEMVPEIYRGIFDVEKIQSLFENYPNILGGWEDENCSVPAHEGYVVRTTGSFHFNDFQKNYAKFVRKGHVKSGNNWMYEKIIPNKLRR